ncbi:hypothetical protein F8M41_006890 [Gigaspora margarita]|uniref:Uncharacterized protein n=1 Tax=Gigaspora margarita TaxID=4874 RepID=A0A8H3X8C7_GIGMA|nr:hypothetical protein F8M41_006890 [Gigaspora margarita]
MTKYLNFLIFLVIISVFLGISASQQCGTTTCVNKFNSCCSSEFSICCPSITTCSAGKTKAQCCGEHEEACGDGECCPRVMLFFQISIPCLQA